MKLNSKKITKSFMISSASFLVKMLLMTITIIMYIMAYNAAIAWFSTNKEVDATGTQIK